MKRNLVLFFLTISPLFLFSQDGNFNTINFTNLLKNGSATGMFGWGDNFDRTIDMRPNPHPNYGTMIINHHTGLTLSAHSYYGGIRFYNQGYPGIWDPLNGAKMVMSIMNGNVGMNTTTPAYQLDVNGDIHQNDANSFYGANLRTNDYSTMIFTSRAWETVQGANGKAFSFQTHNNAGNNGQLEMMAIYYGEGGKITMVPNGGNVGIGTTSPDAKLAVNGKIHAEEVKVDLNVPGPDYVFEADYKLPTLNEIQKYFTEHKHLPEVPSANEMKENGINLSEMNMLLLKKVEELTLHLIEKALNDILKRLDKIENENNNK